MEMHFVHADAEGDLAVVGVLMEKERGESAFTALWPSLPDDRDQYQYQYDGSLTTPPCTEGVRWIVLDDLNRPTQPLADRLVTVVED